MVDMEEEDTAQGENMRPTGRREGEGAAQRSTGTEEERTGDEEVDEVEGRAATTQAATPRREEGEEREQPTATTQQSIVGEREKVPRPAQAVNRPKRKNRGQPVYFAQEKKRQATTNDGRRKRGMARIRYVDNGSGRGGVALEQTVAVGRVYMARMEQQVEKDRDTGRPPGDPG